jgi:excisionase family DNA binding protein
VSGDQLQVALPPELVEAIARRAAELVADRCASGDLWLDVEQSAAYIAGTPQRIYDLRRAGKLPKTGDGRRALIRRSALDRYLEQGSA